MKNIKGQQLNKKIIIYFLLRIDLMIYDQTFYFQNNKYLINDFPGNLRGKMVEIRKYQNGDIKFFFQNETA